MKKSLLILFIFVFTLLKVAGVNACELGVTLINQDPYPAVPGEYVKLIFQVTGVEDSSCTDVTIELIDKYPISFDPGESSLKKIKGGTYQRDFSSYLLASYKVRIDDNALDGENDLEVILGTGNVSSYNKRKTFTIEIEDSQADFEIHIDKYSFSTNELTFEILNIAESDVEALTIEIPKQEAIRVRGTNRVVVGDLDSSEFTTADFKASMEDGEFLVKILYTDQTGIRRQVEKTILFDSSYFVSDDKGGSSQVLLIVVVIVIVIIIVWWIFRKRKKRKLKIRRRGISRL